ncbi:DUF3850 domain-containing protein [Enterobacter cloacae]|uniref:DUF3850 domain-containing protein n=1 Tax=Enterobacter cloacae TaxID=550 RepID=UPI002021FCB9|nr:DUF3850 domain-containing protein [Enterobacter cloacae]MCL8178391.1 DUF3850 domain-containing protein [Enterobacter cloacae]MCM7409729.1 DUF3850 domain-containing protein [Enterobacter cloacae]
MNIKLHTLKIAPKHFNDVVAGQKKAELRKDDNRGYKDGDVLVLCEWKHGRYTGREWTAVVTHVLPVREVMNDSDNWVMLSIRSLHPVDAMLYLLSGGEL